MASNPEITMNFKHSTPLKLQVARDGQIIGEFTSEELTVILHREDGGLLLTDYVFDPVNKQWRRISEVLTEQRSLQTTGIWLLLILGCAIFIWRNLGGLSGIWDTIKTLCGY